MKAEDIDEKFLRNLISKTKQIQITFPNGAVEQLDYGQLSTDCLEIIYEILNDTEPQKIAKMARRFGEGMLALADLFENLTDAKPKAGENIH